MEELEETENKDTQPYSTWRTKWKAYEWGNTRKSYWRISNSPILHRTLGNSYWRNQGLKSLEARYKTCVNYLN